MSAPARYLVRILASDDPLALQAARVASLRARAAAAQAKTGVPDPVLIAEFAEAQRAYLEATIQSAKQRKAEVQNPEPPAPPAPTPAPSVPAEPVAEKPPAQPRGKSGAGGKKRRLKGSNGFWLTVIFLLTFLACFLHSPYSYPE